MAAGSVLLIPPTLRQSKLCQKDAGGDNTVAAAPAPFLTYTFRHSSWITFKNYNPYYSLLVSFSVLFSFVFKFKIKLVSYHL